MRPLKLITLSLLSSILLSGSCRQDSRQIEFTASGWKTARLEERRWMAEDFLKKYDLKGQPFADVKELLGEPDIEDDTWHYALDLKDSDWVTSDNRNPQDYKDLALLIHFKSGTVSYLMLNYTFRPPEDLRFDSGQWRTGNPSLRMRMAVKLILSEVLKGKKKQEVEQALGRPEQRSENIEFRYNLGLRIMDIVYLVFVVGPDQKVLEAKIAES